MDFDSQFALLGHAQVIVVLKPEVRRGKRGQGRLALEETKDVQEEAVRKLRPHFKSFSNSRQSLLAKEPEIAAATGAGPPRYAVDARARAASAASPTARYFPNLGVIYGTVDRAGLAAMADDRDVAEVIEAPEFRLIRPVVDAALAGPEPGLSWGIRRLNVPALWDRGLTGEGVLIGHLDTGVDAGHPALAGKIDAYAFFDRSGRQVANAEPADSGRHGTHTAGILVGAPIDSFAFGVAPGARLASASVIEQGDTVARVFAALDWCIGQGVRIVSLSLGWPGYMPQISAILTLLRQRGILPVIAVGNEGVQTSRSPGNLPEALSVGALDDTDQIWASSSSQQFATTPKRTVPTVIGPGAGVWSCVPKAGMLSMSGTSMATPHIAGLAALLIQHRPEATVDQIEKAIVASCKRPSGISTLRGNRGVPDAVEALARL